MNTAFAATLAACLRRGAASSPASTPRTAASPSKDGRPRSRSRPTKRFRSSSRTSRAFLYTHVDGEGLMQGFPIETAARLRKLTQRQLIVAGGIRSQQEIDALDAIGRRRGGRHGRLHRSACSLIRRALSRRCGIVERTRDLHHRVCWRAELPSTFCSKGNHDHGDEAERNPAGQTAG